MPCLIDYSIKRPCGLASVGVQAIAIANIEEFKAISTAISGAKDGLINKTEFSGWFNVGKGFYSWQTAKDSVTANSTIAVGDSPEFKTITETVSGKFVGTPSKEDDGDIIPLSADEINSVLAGSFVIAVLYKDGRIKFYGLSQDGLSCSQWDEDTATGGVTFTFTGSNMYTPFQADNDASTGLTWDDVLTIKGTAA